MALLASVSATAAQSPGGVSHHWFLANLADCGGHRCVVVSPVFEATAVRPDTGVLSVFQADAEARFHGLALQPLVEPIGSRWRDEVEVEREQRVAGWRRLGWAVYEVAVGDQPVPDRFTTLRADAEAEALAAGYRAERRGELGVAQLWYRRALDLAPEGLVARQALQRIAEEMRERARALSTGSGG